MLLFYLLPVVGFDLFYYIVCPKMLFASLRYLGSQFRLMPACECHLLFGDMHRTRFLVSNQFVV
jgi:hypothetical protein